MTRFVQAALLTLFAISFPVYADDVSGERHLLCTTLHSDFCLANEGCATVEPTDLNIPRFIRVDAKERKLATTVASGENRETVADSSSRSGGQLVLQGVEAGRAYSLFIDEASGHATFAAASDGFSVAVFAACTPETGK